MSMVTTALAWPSATAFKSNSRVLTDLMPAAAAKGTPGALPASSPVAD